MTKKDNKFLKLFDEKQKTHEELKTYILGKGSAIDMIKEKKFRNLLKEDNIASNNLSSYISEISKKNTLGT